LILFKWPCLLSFGCWVLCGGDNPPDAKLMSRVISVGVASCDCLLWWVNCAAGLLWDCGGRLGVLDCESWSTKTTYSDLYIHAQVLWCLETSVHAYGDWAACCLSYSPASLVPGWYFGWWLDGDKLDLLMIINSAPLIFDCHL
jgi:hypothetical protein